MDAKTLSELTATIVGAYVERRRLAPADLPGLIVAVHKALKGLGDADAQVSEPVDQPTMAQVRRSIRPDGLLSFIDGRAYKHLKRHLTLNGLTPQSYRERYGLPSDYPMVAPEYSALRSALAKQMGLGRKLGQKAPARR